jgi:hypothetical protein
MGQGILGALLKILGLEHKVLYIIGHHKTIFDKSDDKNANLSEL